MSSILTIYTYFETRIFYNIILDDILNIENTLKEKEELLNKQKLELLIYCFLDKSIKEFNNEELNIESIIFEYRKTFDDLLETYNEFYSDYLKYLEIKELLSEDKVKFTYENGSIKYFIKRKNNFIEVNKNKFKKYSLSLNLF